MPKIRKYFCRADQVGIRHDKIAPFGQNDKESWCCKMSASLPLSRTTGIVSAAGPPFFWRLSLVRSARNIS